MKQQKGPQQRFYNQQQGPYNQPKKEYNQPPYYSRQNNYNEKSGSLRHSAYIVIMVGAIISLIVSILAFIGLIASGIVFAIISDAWLALLIAAALIPGVAIVLNAILIAKAKQRLVTNECSSGIIALSFIAGILFSVFYITLIGAILLVCSVSDNTPDNLSQGFPNQNYNQNQQQGNYQAGQPNQPNQPRNVYNKNRPYNQQNENPY